jgi:hypothetical protein
VTYQNSGLKWAGSHSWLHHEPWVCMWVAASRNMFGGCVGMHLATERCVCSKILVVAVAAGLCVLTKRGLNLVLTKEHTYVYV